MGDNLFRIKTTGFGWGTVPRTAALAVAAGLAALGAPLAVAAPAQALTVTVASHFVWTATSANTSGDTSFISNGEGMFNESGSSPPLTAYNLLIFPS